MYGDAWQTRCQASLPQQSMLNTQHSCDSELKNFFERCEVGVLLSVYAVTAAHLQQASVLAHWWTPTCCYWNACFCCNSSSSEALTGSVYTTTWHCDR